MSAEKFYEIVKEFIKHNSVSFMLEIVVTAVAAAENEKDYRKPDFGRGKRRVEENHAFTRGYYAEKRRSSDSDEE